MSDVVRVGCVPYLCSKVLIHTLGAEGPGHRLTLDVPSRLIQQLRDGQLDVALVSSIEFFRRKDYLIIPDISINTRLEAWSIRLFYKEDITKVRRVGLDPASNCSNALLKILLAKRFALKPEYVELAPGQDPMGDPSLDAFLKIGDPALTFQGPLKTMDLGDQWWQFARLPFVFAVWLARKGTDLKGVDKKLFMAKREGLRRVDEIVRQHALPLGLTEKKAAEYITRILGYDLSNIELGGFQTFYRYAIQMGLAEEGINFAFYNRS